MEKGALIGHPVQGIRVVLQDGQTHAVDSSDMAFRFAATMAVRESILKAGAQVLEPIMSVEVSKIANRKYSSRLYKSSTSISWSFGKMMCFPSHYLAPYVAEFGGAHRYMYHARWLTASSRRLRNRVILLFCGSLGGFLCFSCAHRQPVLVDTDCRAFVAHMQNG